MIKQPTDLPWKKDKKTQALIRIFKLQLQLLFDAHQLSGEARHKRLLASLKSLLKYCHTSVPYYRDCLGKFDLESVNLENYQQLPILSKDDLREHAESLLSSTFNIPDHPSRMSAFYTSGSTGTPLMVYRSEQHILFSQAINIYYHLVHNRQFHLSNLNVITTENNLLDAHDWVSGLNTGPGYTLRINEDSEFIFDTLMELQPDYIQTHPSTLKRLVDISIERGTFPKSLKEARTFGELLEPNIKSSCLEHWNIPLADNYSSEETAMMAFSCPHGDHYHIIDENVYLEVIDEQGNICQPGELGRVVVTQLKNLAMPLLRYELGDMAIQGKRHDCGFELPTIESFQGRRRNLVVLPDGNTFHPVFDEEKILAVAPIQRYQLIQKDTQNIDIYIQGERLDEEKQQALAKSFSDTFKGFFNLNFKYQNEIQFSERSKFEIFKSEVKAEKLKN